MMFGPERVVSHLELPAPTGSDECGRRQTGEVTPVPCEVRPIGEPAGKGRTRQGVRGRPGAARPQFGTGGCGRGSEAAGRSPPASLGAGSARSRPVGGRPERLGPPPARPRPTDPLLGGCERGEPGRPGRRRGTAGPLVLLSRLMCEGPGHRHQCTLKRADPVSLTDARHDPFARPYGLGRFGPPG